LPIQNHLRHINMQNERILSLIEFAQQSARLKLNPTKDLGNYKIFHRYEHDILSLPGVCINPSTDQEEIWISIERFLETTPPKPQDNQLDLWLDLSNKPEIEPALKNAIEPDKLQSKTTHLDENTPPDNPLILLTEYESCEQINVLFQAYVKEQWRPWATDEKIRRRCIKLYSDLFTLKQQLEGSINDTQIELVFGMGIGLWKTTEFNIKYPLITQSVEISLNEKNMTLEIRPRQTVEAQFELEVYMSVDNLGVADLEKSYTDLISKQTEIFSPFERISYESQLQLASTHLDSKGIYWPNQIKTDDRALPEAGEELKVTDTWVLFARPRSKSLFIQDLENFKKKLTCDKECEISGVISDIVTDPLSEHRELLLPNFRGLSNIGYSGAERIGDVTELYFPLPFNEEQVSIVQRLECTSGVVVQGPPDTGKTHTIANIIAHYMANGKRVLVTSMKEPALSVLKEKLPQSIQPLAIALLTNEQDGMKQFEFAVSKIAQELQIINRSTLEQEIKRAEQFIDQLHGKLARTDRSINDWAKKNIEPIDLDGHLILPGDAAKEVRQSIGQFEWLEDKISIPIENNPQFDNTDIVHLREARRNLGIDLDYLNKKIPDINLIRLQDDILDTHQALVKKQISKEFIEKNNIVQISKPSEKIHMIQELLGYIDEIHAIDNKVKAANKPWSGALKLFLEGNDSSQVTKLIDNLSNELNSINAERAIFLERPVSLPNDLQVNDGTTQAIANKMKGKSPFGISGALMKRPLIKKIEQISILSKTPRSPDEWEHVHRYFLISTRVNVLILKWNNIHSEFSLFSAFEIDIGSVKKIKEEIEIYCLIKRLLELECLISEHGKQIFDNHQIVDPTADLIQLKNCLNTNIDLYNSAVAGSKKDGISNKLAPFNGKITTLLKQFVNDDIGNSLLTETEIQTRWSNLSDELKRVHSLKKHLDDIDQITSLITESGGVVWAQQLKSVPLDGTTDYLLPDNWQQIWRVRRLANHLQAAGQYDEFKKLALQRTEVEKLLAKTYQDVIANRTWLNLANNATPDIKAALQAFQSAIAKIGKGTGKRALRYRRDAKNASARTNKAIPCWIMPHYRISESLPPDFGCFDLVIIDEASQSDLSALPAILRAKKLLVVGDDKQVSPDAVGLDQSKIDNLRDRFLSNQVELYAQAMTPERSIYDLCKIVYADSQIMLREHFRSVAPIIEYSKREFYNHELKPLRLPTKSERLDPPLIDVIVEDGYRNQKENMGEARFIVDEIIKICDEPSMVHRTIGVVSLLGNEQSRKIWEMLQQEISPDVITRHKITCGDALTFQGKERDIMFLSMVVTKDNCKANSRDTYAQRFNVAASRARDRMYLVRSIEIDDLSMADTLRRQLIEHFASPFAQDEVAVKNLRDLCESGFESEVYDLLTDHGYRVIPQVKVGTFRLDMVVEGHNDARLAIECDGDQYHDESRWEADMNRQRILARAGWKFWRCFASNFVMNKENIIQDLTRTLTEHSIEPIGTDGMVSSIHCEQRRIKIYEEPELLSGTL